MNLMPASARPTDSTLRVRLKARIGREWLASTSALLVLTFCLSYFGDSLWLTGLNNAVYDRLLALLIHEPASDDIMIVAIDDASIEELGYWPWRRAKHAELLAPLSGARAVAFDLLFAEPNPAYPDDDLTLARAIADHGRVVLPLVINRDNRSISPPIPELAKSTPHFGSINIYPDTDGVIRSASLQNMLDNGTVVNHLSLAMLEAGHDTETLMRLQDTGRAPQRIAYARFARDSAIVPYGHVLDGRIPADTFDGKYVLVGSWGSGLGDTFATPHSSILGVMPGVEVLANLLNGALTDRWIRQPGRLTLALLSLIPVLICCMALRYLSPQRSFLFSLTLVAGIFGIAAALLHSTLWWVSPLAAMAGTALAYPVWSWRSQQAALRHIDSQMALLRDEGLIHAQPAHPGAEKSDNYFPARQDHTLLSRIGQLHQAVDRIRVAQRQRNETIRFLSHDMRAPLNSILALTELQRSAPEQTAGANTDTLAQFDHYANKTLALVDGFISLNRAEAIELSLQPVNLTELITQACEDVWVQAHKKQIRIDSSSLPEAAWVQADASLLERAWINLLDNAVKYSDSGTTVTCTLHRDGDDWVCRIQDQGRGMEPSSLESAFSPFVRFTDHGRDNPPGVGLGLAFVLTAIARHDGRIDAESPSGKGTCFTIRLAALDDAG